MTRDELFLTLARQLDDLKKVNEQLLRVVRDMHDVIIKNESEKLATLVKEESDCLSEISKIEMNRERTVRVLALNFGIKYEELTVAKLINFARRDGKNKPERVAKLEEVAEELLAVLTELHSVNSKNKELVRVHLHYSNFMIENLLVTPQLNNIYGNEGDLVLHDRKSTLNSEI